MAMIDNDLVAPRPLTKSDESHLRTVFELQLRVTDEAAEEDAADLLDYAIDMIARGKNVKSVIEELEFMQYDVCDSEAAQRIGKCLTAFLREITREMEGKPNGLDLSTQAASRKPSREMHETLLSGSVSVAQRSKMGIYNSKGELVKQWAGVRAYEESDVDDRRRLDHLGMEDEKRPKELAAQADGSGLNLSARASSLKPHVEVELLQKTSEERRGMKNQIYDEAGNLVAWNRKDDENPKDMDLSTQGNLRKKQAELEALTYTSAHRRDVKGKIYDENGKLISWSDYEDLEKREVDPANPADQSAKLSNLDNSKSVEKKKMEEFQAIMKDRSLSREERSRRIEEMKRKYSSSSTAGSLKQRPAESESLDFSALAVTRKNTAEMRAMLLSSDISLKERSKQGIYDENGFLTKQWATINAGSDCGDGGGNSVKLSAGAAAKRNQSELEFLRERTNGGFVLGGDAQSSNIYNEQGELVGDWNEGEESGQGPGMDLSATGSTRKKSQELDAIRATGAQRKGVKDRIYDQNGQLNAWARLKDTDERTQSEPTVFFSGEPEMDLSAEGYRRKKSKELDSIRASGSQRKGVKDRIYDSTGRLNAWASLSEKEAIAEQEEREMDLSAEGMKRKKSREIEFLRATGNNRTAKQQMYDANGRLIGAGNNIGEQDMIYDSSGRLNACASLSEKEAIAEQEEREMDVSAEGMKRKKSREIEFLRATGNNRTAKQQMYDANGRLIGAGNNIGEQDMHNSSMDLSAEGMRRKKALEMEAIRASSNRKGAKQKMYDPRGNLVAQTNNKEGEQDRHNPDMDLSAEGMRLKKAREMEALRARARESREEATKQIYDENGQLNAWTSLIEDDDGHSNRISHNPGMDLSAEGMRLKKAREMEALRMRSNPQGIKQKMYDEQGNIVGCRKNEGELIEDVDCHSNRNSHNPDMDLSAEGMRLKKAREMEALRMRSKPQGIKQKMYDEQGNIVGCRKNEGEQNRHNPDMDLSAEGMRLKKAREMEALRMRSKPQDHQMYDENGQLNTWTKLTKSDDSDVDSNCSSEDMDLSPDGMKKKKAREIKSLRLSVGASNKMQMYDDDGNIVGAINNIDEQSTHNSQMDLTANGMLKKKSLDLQALRDGTMDLKTVNAPRKLTTDETASLREMMKSKLTIPNDSYEEDAEDLLDYALDMIGDGNPIDNVVEELVFMELEVFDAEIADSFGQSLASFLLNLQGDVTLVKGSRAAICNANKKEREKKEAQVPETIMGRPRIDLSAMAAAQREARQMAAALESGPDNAKEHRIDLSAMAAAQREARNMAATLKSGPDSAKERSKQTIYDSQGALVKQWEERDDDTPACAVHGINLSAQAAAKRASREVDSLLHKNKAGGSLGDRISKYKEFVKPRGDFHHESDDHDEVRMNSLEALSLKPGMQYDSNGELINQCANVEKEDITDIDAHIDEKRRLYYQQIEEKENLRERVAHGDQQSAEYEEELELNNGAELKLSALSQSRKPRQEVNAIRSVADSQGTKREIYDENGVLIKQWANVREDDDIPAQKAMSLRSSYAENSVDEQRKKEFSALMKDRSLSREERAIRIAKMKEKYSSSMAFDQIGERVTSSAKGTEESSKLDLSALATSRKASAEIRALLLSSETTAKERSKQEIYDENGVLVKQWAKIDEDQETSELDSSALAFARKANAEMRSMLASSETSAKEQYKQDIYDENGILVKQWASINEDRSKEEQGYGKDSYKSFQKQEIDSIICDISSSREQTTNEPTCALAKSPGITTSNHHGKSAALDDQRRKELQSVMKDRTLDREEKNRRLEAIKSKYDSMDPEEVEGKEQHGHEDGLDTQNDAKDDTIDLSAAAFSKKHLKELEKIKATNAEGTSLEDRKSVFNNETTVYYDSVSFALSQNKSEAARQMAKRETVENAKKYNYSYGDGGVVDDTRAEFKAIGDDSKVAKKEAKESAKLYSYKMEQTINCDPLAFAVKNNKSEAARETAKRDAKESAKFYNYQYTG